MLSTLTVWNFALIAHAELRFGAGLNILTGETGAGKSILIDALGACLGRRLSPEAIRTGCDWLRVEAIFDIAGLDGLKEYLQEAAIDADESGDELIVTRQITAKGKSSILVNGCRTTLATLRAIGDYLFDIHGQNENLAILKPENKFRLVSDGSDALERYRAAFTAWKKADDELRATKTALANAEERRELLAWQADEIKKISPKPGEDEKLEQEINKLANAEKISDDVMAISRLLGGYGENVGAVAAVEEVIGHLEHLDRYDSELNDLIDRLESSRAELADAFDRVSDYRDTLEFDPNRLDRLQTRLDRIDRLRRKYGATIEEILARYEKIKAELERIDNGESDIAELEKTLSRAEAVLKETAATLTERRKAVATKISAGITGELSALGMNNAVFRVEVLPAADKFTASGADEIALDFSANAGEPPKPLEKVASGGELSRITLAIKSAAADSGETAPSMVFDEIDTGIGGRTAQMVASRIARAAKGRQVLCITHLAAIAAMADHHLFLAKSSEGGQTTTTVRAIDGDERTAEIARMATGLDLSPAALANAREMISHAEAEKRQIA